MHMMGTARDQAQRTALARTDSAQRQANVLKAEKLIMKNRVPVNGAAVEALLKNDSSVPVPVRNTIC